MSFLLKNFRTMLSRRTASSLLNVCGMGVAFAAVYLIAVQVHYDLSYNRRVPNADRICRLEHPSWMEEGRRFARWNRRLPQQMCSAFPEIEACGTIGFDGVEESYSVRRRQTIDNFTLRLSDGEQAGFDVFAFEAIDGSIDDLRTSDGLLLSASTAARLDLKAGDRIHVGAGADGERQLVVTAVYRDFPRPSAFDDLDGFRLLPPVRTASDRLQSNPHGSWSYSFYLRLAPGTDPAKLGGRMADWLREQSGKEGMSEEEVESQMKLLHPYLDPFADLYFAEEADGSDVPKGNRTTTRTFLAIAALILAVAFINFVNFFFALMPVRMRAVHICKVFGASQTKLRLEILLETTVLVAAALVVGAGLAVIFADTPLAGYLSGPVSLRHNVGPALALGLGALALGWATSCYPAWYLTRFRPAFVLRGAFQASEAGRRLRYVLVGVQYAIALVLIVATLFIQRQHRYMMDFDMGFDREQLYGVDVPQSALASFERLDALVDRLKRNPAVVAVGATEDRLVEPQCNGWGYMDAETGNLNLFNTMRVGWDFLAAAGIELVEGRSFGPADERSEGDVFVCNETAARTFGLTHETQLPRSSGVPTSVVGICKDFHFKPVQYGIEPFAFIVCKRSALPPTCLYVRMAAGVSPSEARDYIRKTVLGFDASIEPERIEPRFVDEELEVHYRRERRVGTLVLLFSVLAILITMMGVFGLVLFETQYRRREIGIRRVNGATVGEILALFNRRFLTVVVLCSLVALPVGWFVVDRWLSTFAYRTPMAWWIFAAAVGVLVALTLLTVTARSWHAANENPSHVMKGN